MFLEKAITEIVTVFNTQIIKKDGSTLEAEDLKMIADDMIWRKSLKTASQ